MKKLLVLTVITGVLMCVGGCESVQLDGFSVGVMYLNTDIITTCSVDSAFIGELTGKQTTSIETIVPTFSLNFKFK